MDFVLVASGPARKTIAHSLRYSSQSAGDTPLWSRDRLIQRPRRRGRESGAIERFSRPVIPEPVLSGLKARDDEVAGLSEVRGRMLVRRRIAAADVAALGAAPQVEPPLSGGKTFDTSRPGRNG
jgi:hypothetical protein